MPQDCGERGDAGGCLSSKAGRPIIIVRKVAVHHDDEHGGAWKVAYADFVTAMMALFIVLWLLSASEKVQKAVGGYFLDPSGKGRQTGTTNAGSGETLTLNRDNLKDLKEKLEQVLRQIPAFQHMEKQIRITLTTEGLRVDLIETERGLVLRNRQSQAQRSRHRTLKSSSGGAGETAEQNRDRRTHRLAPLRPIGLFELGIVGRSRQCRPQSPG